jgi:recombinational DNA repair protein RecR
MSQPEPLTRLIEQLQRLPGIGRKSAQRLAPPISRSEDLVWLEEIQEMMRKRKKKKDRYFYLSTRIRQYAHPLCRAVIQ